MMIRFTPEADADLAEACQWYARQREDLDLEFMGRIDEASSRIRRNPQSYPIAYGSLRRAVVRRFPSANKSSLPYLVQLPKPEHVI